MTASSKNLVKTQWENIEEKDAVKLFEELSWWAAL
jgi:hypothetical protein